MEDMNPLPLWAVRNRCVYANKMKELEERGYQHPDRMSALSIIPLADEQS